MVLLLPVSRMRFTASRACSAPGRRRHAYVTAWGNQGSREWAWARLFFIWVFPFLGEVSVLATAVLGLEPRGLFLITGLRIRAWVGSVWV